MKTFYQFLFENKNEDDKILTAITNIMLKNAYADHQNSNKLHEAIENSKEIFYTIQNKETSKFNDEFVRRLFESPLFSYFRLHKHQLDVPLVQIFGEHKSTEYSGLDIEEDIPPDHIAPYRKKTSHIGFEVETNQDIVLPEPAWLKKTNVSDRIILKKGPAILFHVGRMHFMIYKEISKEFFEQLEKYIDKIVRKFNSLEDYSVNIVKTTDKFYLLCDIPFYWFETIDVHNSKLFKYIENINICEFLFYSYFRPLKFALMNATPEIKNSKIGKFVTNMSDIPSIENLLAQEFCDLYDDTPNIVEVIKKVIAKFYNELGTD
jgi:hypothetical protein